MKILIDTDKKEYRVICCKVIKYDDAITAHELLSDAIHNIKINLLKNHEK